MLQTVQRIIHPGRSKGCQRTRLIGKWTPGTVDNGVIHDSQIRHIKMIPEHMRRSLRIIEMLTIRGAKRKIQRDRLTRLTYPDRYLMIIEQQADLLMEIIMK